MRVLVIPEDFRKDQYILKPVITAMLTAAGKPRSTVRVCQNPLLRGISQALDREKIEEIISSYKGMVDLFLLCVDRDGDKGRHRKLADIEKHANALLPSGRFFIAEHAWQEIEVWALAGLDLLPGWSWQEVRAEANPKERYFLEIAKSRNVLQEPGEGRKTLGNEASRRYDRIRQRCTEDIERMENRIREWVQKKGKQ